MNIYLVQGVGSGKTSLAAFDAALWDAGIANQNLIYLSSMIPPGSKLIKKHLKNNHQYGQRLYCVIAEHRVVEIKHRACAGLGWTQDKTGKGLFVEHTGSNKKEVKELIKQTISDMMRYRNDKFGKINYLITEIKCQKEPVCALVAAVYKIEGWE